MALEPFSSTSIIIESHSTQAIKINSFNLDLVEKEQETEAEITLRQLECRCWAFWNWDDLDKSSHASVGGLDKTTVTFYAVLWSQGTAGARTSQPVVTDGISYWEISIGDSLYGTSQMVGVSTKKTRLDINDFRHLLGEDEHSWGLSYTGRLHHNGKARSYCKPFAERRPVTVGVLVDMQKGELSYFKNGKSLGVAFKGLHNVKAALYPTVTSTARNSSMTIGRGLTSFADLKDRCRHVITTAILCGSREEHGAFMQNVDILPVPGKVKNYISNQHNFRRELDSNRYLH